MSQFGLHVDRAALCLVRHDTRGVSGVRRPLDPALEGDARRAAVQVALGEAARELKLTARSDLHLALPRGQAIVKQVPLPPAENGELERLVRFQAMKELPFDLEDVALAWARLEPTPEAAEEGRPGDVQFVALRHEILGQVQAAAREANLRVGRLEVSTSAAARALILLAPEAAEGEVLLVLVGGQGAELVLVREGRLAFTRHASVGAADLPRLTQEVTRSFLAARQSDPGAALGADPSASTLGRMGPPDACYVAGESAGAEGVLDAIQQAVKIAPQVLRGIDAPDGASFVVARGLADPRLVPGVPRLDLARRAEARREQSSRRRLTAVAVGAVAVALAVGLGARLWVAARESRVAALQEEKDALDPVTSATRTLREEVALAEAWTERQGRELEVLLAVSRALPTDDVYLTQLRWGEGRSLRLTGRAREWDAVGRFLAALEEDPLFVQPRFENIRRPDGGRGDDEPGVQFNGTTDLRGLK
jgi:Tfp pilus assembly protein PilN